MKLLVTGATGFLGGALVPLLVEEGHQVRVLARGGAPDAEALGCELSSGDVRDPETVRRAVHGCPRRRTSTVSSWAASRRCRAAGSASWTCATPPAHSSRRSTAATSGSATCSAPPTGSSASSSAGSPGWPGGRLLPCGCPARSKSPPPT